jgi:hypothetical protein
MGVSGDSFSAGLCQFDGVPAISLLAHFDATNSFSECAWVEWAAKGYIQDAGFDRTDRRTKKNDLDQSTVLLAPDN